MTHRVEVLAAATGTAPHLIYAGWRIPKSPETTYDLPTPILRMLVAVIVIALLCGLVATEPSSPGGEDR